MSIAYQMERKRVRLREIRRDMDGMSPRLGLWQKLKAEAEQIGKELSALGEQRVRTHLERIQKHEMEPNVIYAFTEEGKPAAKALADDGECFTVSIAYTQNPDPDARMESCIKAVANSLYDIQQGGNGYGSSGKYRPPTFTYPVVYLQ